MKSLAPSVLATANSAICAYCGLPVSGPPSTVGPVYCCYGCRFAASITRHDGITSPIAGPESALGFSVFFTMNVVMLTMALWSYADKIDSPFQQALGHFLRYGAMAFAIPVLLLLGRPLLSHAWQGLQRGVLSTDLLLASGVLAAFAVSVFNTWRGAGHVYYEVGCIILVLVSLGRWMEAVGRSHASDALAKLERLIPETVRRREHDRDVMTQRTQVVIGDQLRVLAGERIPVDGRVISGRAVVDEQFFTGESIPVEKRRGDLLLGGSLNLDGDLIIEITVLPDAGALGRLVDAVRAARLTKGYYQRLSDTWSHWLFPVISVIAVMSLVIHGIRVNWEYGLLTALSVVLIACPCALALATPLAVWTALGTAAQKGVLFRSGVALETLAGIRAIRWDKTGTLTTGTPRVERFVCEQSAQTAAALAWSQRLAGSSRHVFSQAIQEFLANNLAFESCSGHADLKMTQSRASDCIQTAPGRGLSLTLADDQRAALGSIRWMDECGFAWGPKLSGVLANPQTADRPMTAIGFDGSVQGLFLLEEDLRADAMTTLNRCSQLGLHQAVLTGDRQTRALRFESLLDSAPAGRDSSFTIQAELLPEEKLAAVREARQQYGCVAMVGDGLNDAPALAAANVGIALGCGADVTRDSSDVCLLSTDLQLVPWAYELSRRTVRTIRTNLAWSFGYNSIGVVVAATGQLHPALAAVLMVASSLMVLGNSLRLSTLRSENGASASRETDHVPPKIYGNSVSFLQEVT